MSFPSEEGGGRWASLLPAAGQPAATPAARAEQAEPVYREERPMKYAARGRGGGGVGMYY